MRKLSRKGFTLVELLVVIAVIGTLVALLLPAIQAARETARRLHCSNNLKQLGLALNAAYDVYKEYPRGLYGDSDRNSVNAEDGLGWAVKLLPYMEQGSTYKIIIQAEIPGHLSVWTPGIFHSSDAAGKKIPGGTDQISVFRCPDSPLAGRVPRISWDGGEYNALFSDYATSDYKGSRGFCDRGMFWRTSEGLYTQTCWRNVNGVPTAIQKLPYTRIRIQDVRDGTSHTIAFGESSYYTNIDRWPIWLGGSVKDETTLFKTETPMNSFKKGYSRRLPVDAVSDDLAFGWHSHGLNFAFVDGSVHFLAEDIDLETYENLGDRMDGQAIGIY